MLRTSWWSSTILDRPESNTEVLVVDEPGLSVPNVGILADHGTVDYVRFQYKVYGRPREVSESS